MSIIELNGISRALHNDLTNSQLANPPSNANDLSTTYDREILRQYVNHIPIYIIHIIMDTFKISVSMLFTIHMFLENRCQSHTRNIYKATLLLFLCYIVGSFIYNVRKLHIVSTQNINNIWKYYNSEETVKKIKIFNLFMLTGMVVYSGCVYDYLCADIIHWLVVACVYLCVKIITTIILYTKLKFTTDYIKDPVDLIE